MPNHSRAWHGLLCALLLCTWLAAGAGCRPADTPAPDPTPTGTPVQVETPTPPPEPTPTAIPPGAPQTLTVWISELISPVEGDDRSLFFEQQIMAFQATHPGLTIEVLWKKTEGKGGAEELLTAASAVAPAVMPDLVVIDSARLAVLAQRGLVVPLYDVLDADLLDDFYPTAITAGTVNGQLVGLPFETTVEHAIYNTSKIAVPPVSWAEVFASGATYVFPTLGREGLVNDAFLIQYLSTGAQLLDGDGRPALDLQALADVLTFYRDGLENGAILTDVLGYDTVRSGWRKYLQAEVVMSNMTSNLDLEGRGLLKVSKATWIPTQDGQPPVALARASAWALTARTPHRIELAARLLTWLVNPQNMATWSLAAERLPTRRAAFEQMPRDDADYVSFVYEQLEYAVPYPGSEAHKRIYRAMQQAVDAVLRNGEEPVVAAEAILRAVGQTTQP